MFGTNLASEEKDLYCLLLTRRETSHHTDHIVRLDPLLHPHRIVHYSKHTYISTKIFNSLSDNEA